MVENSRGVEIFRHFFTIFCYFSVFYRIKPIAKLFINSKSPFITIQIASLFLTLLSNNRLYR